MLPGVLAMHIRRVYVPVKPTSHALAGSAHAQLLGVSRISTYSQRGSPGPVNEQILETTNMVGHFRLITRQCSGCRPLKRLEADGCRVVLGRMMRHVRE